MELHDQVQEVRKNTLKEIGSAVMTMMGSSLESRETQTCDLLIKSIVNEHGPKDIIVEATKSQEIFGKFDRRESTPISLKVSEKSVIDLPAEQNVETEPVCVPPENALINHTKTKKQLYLVDK